MGLLATTTPLDLSKPSVDEIEMDALFDVLRNERRRMVLHFLTHTRSGQATIGELAEQLAAWENDIPVAAVRSTQRKRTYNTLQQHHLPKLDDQGVIAFDRARGQVVLTTDDRQLRMFLNFIPKVTSSGITKFLALGTFFWLALLVNWVGVHIFHVLTPGNAASILGTSFVVFLIAHVYLLIKFLYPKVNGR